ncbi:MAG: DNA-deoxyinosine glycosylase [Zetaproteobacteria bacterium CG1_02_53_45]|nr:MAG: DNA-deoxyinosine glycosylase [Zetaproteobacteria bacterium CG1_02_53_45]
MYDTGFPCAANPDARVLILGSMPSRKSLKKAEYYGHPRNGFWPIMGELFGFNSELDYKLRLTQLREADVALWDVAFQCVRPGSMDSAIELETVVANDFETFFQRHRKIHAIFFNGRKAEELYRKLVQPNLTSEFRQLATHLLPSTSPANAGMNRSQKLEQWKIVRHTLENG